VRVLEKLKKNAWVEIELHEGRNREVRRMFEALSYFVGKLIGVRIGNVEFGQARPGRDSSVDAHWDYQAQTRRRSSGQPVKARAKKARQLSSLSFVFTLR
jgi:23S rRNA pseudouridine2605 synthase